MVSFENDHISVLKDTLFYRAFYTDSENIFMFQVTDYNKIGIRQKTQKFLVNFQVTFI